MRMFGRYLWTLITTWWGAAFLLAGAVSTSVTFIPLYKLRFSLPRWIPGAISIAAWLVAPYRLYQRQQAQIEVVTANQQQPRRASLKIIEEQDSYFIRRSTPESQMPKREAGMYLELSVSIENKGDRAATITAYGLQIECVGGFPDVRPSPQTWVWGLRSQHSIGNSSAVRSYIEVPAERLASNVKIPFMLDSLAPEEAGQIRCELTVRDTEGNSASAWITAVERG